MAVEGPWNSPDKRKQEQPMTNERVRDWQAEYNAAGARDIIPLAGEMVDEIARQAAEIVRLKGEIDVWVKGFVREAYPQRTPDEPSGCETQAPEDSGFGCATLKDIGSVASILMRSYPPATRLWWRMQHAPKDWGPPQKPLSGDGWQRGSADGPKWTDPAPAGPLVMTEDEGFVHIRAAFDPATVPDCPRCGAAHWPQCPSESKVTRLPVPGAKLARLSDIADDLIRELKRQGMETLQAVFQGVLLRVEPYKEPMPEAAKRRIDCACCSRSRSRKYRSSRSRIME
jgi:hypothetical protein